MNCAKRLTIYTVLCFLYACDSTSSEEEIETPTDTAVEDAGSPDTDTDTATGEPPSVIFYAGDIPSTENGAVAKENRFFFIGDQTLYELLPNTEGDSDYAVVTTRDDCDFTGLTAKGSRLYAACAAFDRESPREPNLSATSILWSDLIRIDLDKDEDEAGYISTVRMEGRNFFPNGMTVDEKDDIYVTNSYSTTALNATADTHDAVIRVRIDDDDAFSISIHSVVSAEEGGSFPNGVQVHEDRLWFLSNNTLFEATISDDGLTSLRSIYTAPSSRFLDDFAVLPDNILAIADIPTPDFSGAPWPPVDEPSKLTFLSVGTGKESSDEVEVVEEYTFEHPTTPASVTLTTEQRPVLYVTDFFSGGIYKVTLGEDYKPPTP